MALDSTLYAIGFSNTVKDSDTFVPGTSCDEYHYAENIAGLSDAFGTIINGTNSDTTAIKEEWTNTNGEGKVSLNGISIQDNSIITIYLDESEPTTLAIYDESEGEFTESGYYYADEKEFDLRNFLLAKKLPDGAVIMMKVYNQKTTTE